MAGSAWVLPAVGRVTSPYGPRTLAGAIGDFHYGTDIGAKRGPVYAAAAGVVRSIWQTARGAWVLDIRHADEGGRQIRTRYVHMYRGEISVAVGQRVTAGQRVGSSGASGTGAAHLHFEVLVDGSCVDPQPFMAARGAPLGAGLVGNQVDPGAPLIPAPPDATPIAPIRRHLEDDMKFMRTIDAPEGDGAIFLLAPGRPPRHLSPQEWNLWERLGAKTEGGNFLRAEVDIIASTLS